MYLNAAVRLACVVLYVVFPVSIQAQALHSTVPCAPGNAQTSLQFLEGGHFDWDLPGSASQTFTDVGIPGQSVTYTFTGAIGTLLPAPGNGLQTPAVDFFSNGYTDALSMLTSGIGNNNDITIQIDFAPAIPGELGFEIYHINRNGSGDRVTVTAETVLGASINPNFTTPANPDYQIQGQNRVNANAFNNIEDGQLGVNFSSPDSIRTVTLVWEDCNGCPTSTHGLAIGDFTFCHQIFDNDGDGIENHIDVDDDNDGIPDITEVCNLPFGNPDQDTLDIEITLDGFPDETSWELLDDFGIKIVSGGPYNNPLDIGLVVTERVILGADEDVIFRIYDSFGDALTASPAGSYRILRNGAVEIGPVTSGWSFSSSAFVSALSPGYDPFACIGGDFSGDDDADGIPNYQDADFCTLNAAGVCIGLDLDGDGSLDAFDLDADNDGILDAIEAQGTACYQPPSASVDLLGLPANMASYQNCADNNTSITYGIVPNLDGDDGDGVADYRDRDSDGDGIADFAEGFDFDGDGSSAGDYMTLAASFVPTGGSSASYPNGNDADGDGIPDWLDNLPAVPGFSQTQLPPFQIFGSVYFFDTDGDGIVDLFDPDQGGLLVAYPPDTDLDSDPDWRDTENAVSLPVEFGAFEARLVDEEDALLSWNTEEEFKLGYFEIQRSLNGSDFETIALEEVHGDEDGRGRYTYRDQKVSLLKEKTLYYKIRGVDQDGSHTDSEIRIVQTSDQSKVFQALAYPNPVTTLLNIRLVGSATQATVRLLNGLGQQVWIWEGRVDGVVELRKEMGELSNGLYHLLIENDGEQQVTTIAHP